MEYTMKRKTVSVDCDLASIGIGQRIDVEARYMPTSAEARMQSSYMEKTVRSDNGRPYIVIDGENLYLDKPSSGKFPEEVLKQDGGIGLFIEGLMTFASDLFLVTSNCAYEIKGLKITNHRMLGAEREVRLKPVKAFRGNGMAAVSMSMIYMMTHAGHWNLVYKTELGEHPYAEVAKMVNA